MAEELFQIGIKALVQNKDGKILLLGISKWQGEPAYWDLPGGRMEPGETFTATLKRELKEEIGLDVPLTPDTTELITAVLSNISILVGDRRVPLVLIPFRVSLPEDVVITLDPDGNEETYEWCEPAEAARRLLHKYPPEFCSRIKES